MTKFLFAAAVSAAALAAAPASATVVVSSSANAFGTVPAGQTVFANFDALTPAYTTTGTARVVSGSVSGQYTQPNGTNYLAIAAGGTATFDLGLASLFALDVGTVDTYNTFRIFTSDGGSTLFGQGGIALPQPMDSRTNVRLTFTSNSNQLLTRVELGSVGANALEVDNLSRSAVPEPATWALMLAGFGMVGLGLRSRRRAAVAYA